MITKKRLLWSIVGLAVAVGLWIAIGGLVARQKEGALSRRWGETLSPLESVPGRFPKADANSSALTLEVLATPLGIDLPWPEASNRPRAAEADRKRYEQISPELTRYLKAQLESPDSVVDLLPEAPGQFLSQHAGEMAAIRAHVLQNEPPRWETDISRTISAPFPNFNGLVSLHRLFLANLLELARLGRSAEALADLDVCWKINTSIRERPELMCQMWAGIFATLQAGALRKLKGVPAVWRERLGEHDYRKSYLASQLAEAWVVTEFARRESPWPKVGWLRFIPLPLVRPYVRFCAVDHAETVRQTVAELQKQDPCSFDPAKLRVGRVKADDFYSGWNILSYYLVPPSGERYWRRVCRVMIDFELTQKVLQVKQLQSESRQGTWPRELPGLASSVCSGTRWIYQVAPDGTMSLRFSEKLDWPGSAEGVTLPLVYTEQGGKGSARTLR